MSGDYNWSDNYVWVHMATLLAGGVNNNIGMILNNNAKFLLVQPTTKMAVRIMNHTYIIKIIIMYNRHSCAKIGGGTTF